MADSTAVSSLDRLLEAASARIERLSPQTAYEAAHAGALIVDIRGEADRARDGVVPGSLHVPRTVLEWRLAHDSPWRTPYCPGLDRRVLVLCDHGCSSALAAATLVDLGYRRVGDVIGGYAAWRDAGLPTCAAPPSQRVPGEPAGIRPPGP